MIKELVDYIDNSSGLEFISYVEDVPLVHYTNYADNIVEEGFRYGPSLEHIEWTYGNPSIEGGYVFAFMEEDRGIPYEGGLYLMRKDQALLFNGSGVLCRHVADNFKQVILDPGTITLDRAVIEKVPQYIGR